MSVDQQFLVPGMDIETELGIVILESGDYPEYFPNHLRIVNDSGVEEVLLLPSDN